MPFKASLVQDQDVTLAEESDLTITLLGPTEDNVRHVTDIYVSSDACKQSQYLASIIELSTDQSEITLGGELKRTGKNSHGQEEGENKEGMLVCLAHMHNLSDQRMEKLGLYNISSLGVWYVINLWARLNSKVKVKDALGAWFAKWVDKSVTKATLNLDTARELVFPCQLFDNAPAFATATKFIAYNNIGHIKERPPKGFKGRNMYTGSLDFVAPMNHARTGLKNCMHKSLWTKAGNVLRFDTHFCSCWDATIGRFIAALVDVEAFPIEDIVSRSSIQEIIDRLDKFAYTRPTSDNGGCKRCRHIDWDMVVRKAKANTETYFNGLCLDCMERSKMKDGRGDVDEEYIKASRSVDGKWDSRCRVKHNQNTWYVSWLGRDDVRQKLLKGNSGFYRSED